MGNTSSNTSSRINQQLGHRTEQNPSVESQRAPTSSRPRAANLVTGRLRDFIERRRTPSPSNAPSAAWVPSHPHFRRRPVASSLPQNATTAPPPKPKRTFAGAAAAAASSAAVATPSRTARSRSRNRNAVGESGGKLPSPYSFGRRANSAASTYSVLWSDGFVASPPPPQKPPPKPPRLLLTAASAEAAGSPALAVAPHSPTTRGQYRNESVDESGNELRSEPNISDRNASECSSGDVAAAPPLPPPPPPPPPPPSLRPPHSFSAAAAAGRVHTAAAASAAQQPAIQGRNQDKVTAPLAADAPSTVPAEPRRRRKQLEHGRHREAQPRRTDATTGRPLPRMLDEALNDQTLLAIRRLAAERKTARRSDSYSFGRRANSAASSFSVRWGGDPLAAAAAAAAPSPPPFSVFKFDPAADAVEEDERRHECEMRRAQHEIYDSELSRRTNEATAAAAQSAFRQLHHKASVSAEVSAAAAARQSAPTSTAASEWGAASAAPSHGTAGGQAGSLGGGIDSSGRPLCGRLQPEAGYYDRRPVVPK